MKKPVLIFIAILLANAAGLHARARADEGPGMQIAGTGPADSASLLSALKQGKVSGRLRYFYMATDNRRGLSDYYANALAGKLQYKTADFHRFRFGVGAFYGSNLKSSNLALADSSTGQFNRYESALFDVENPGKNDDFALLDELYLEYTIGKSNLTVGRQVINTPFINLQDGRMRATGVEGAWVQINQLKHTQVEGGWLYSISPRGTSKWYSPGESMGIYPVGLNIDGTKAQYKNAVKSRSLAVLGVTTSLSPNLKIQVWDLFSANVSNSALLQADIQHALKNKNIVFASAQLIRQDAVNDGGNEDVTKTYFEKNGKSLSFGSMIGWKNKQWETSLNYNRITRAGRYLMPREWGRDPFFTFMPRERNEGFGDVHALMAKVNYTFQNPGIKTSFAAGYYKLPDVKNYRLNKYGMPSYTQLNADARYSFKGLLQGLDVQFLVAGKINQGKTYNNNSFEFNKVNMLQYNFVLNYNF
jgi:hypothetical protein